MSASAVEKGGEKSQCSSLSASMFLTGTVQNGKNNKNKTSRDGNSGSAFFNGGHLGAVPNVSATLHRERDSRRAPTSENSCVFKGKHDVR